MHGNRVGNGESHKSCKVGRSEGGMSRAAQDKEVRMGWRKLSTGHSHDRRCDSNLAMPSGLTLGTALCKGTLPFPSTQPCKFSRKLRVNDPDTAAGVTWLLWEKETERHLSWKALGHHLS